MNAELNRQVLIESNDAWEDPRALAESESLYKDVIKKLSDIDLSLKKDVDINIKYDKLFEQKNSIEMRKAYFDYMKFLAVRLDNVGIEWVKHVIGMQLRMSYSQIVYGIDVLNDYIIDRMISDNTISEKDLARYKNTMRRVDSYISTAKRTNCKQFYFKNRRHHQKEFKDLNREVASELVSMYINISDNEFKDKIRELSEIISVHSALVQVKILFELSDTVLNRSKDALNRIKKTK